MQAEDDVGSAFLAAVLSAQKNIDMNALADAVRSGNASAVLDAMNWQGTAEKSLTADLTATVRGLLEASGQQAGTRLTEELRGLPTDYTFRFDLLNPRAVEWIKSHSVELVQLVTDQQRDAIRQIMADAFLEGLPPREAAKLIADHIGLLPDQVDSLGALRQGLEVEGLSATEIDRRVSSAADDYLDQRATVIARHETIVAAYQGAREAWRQADDEGLLPDEAEQEWVTATDQRVCPICEPLDGLTAKLDEPFTGDIYQPGDPHVACRCATVMRPYGKPQGEIRPGS